MVVERDTVVVDVDGGEDDVGGGGAVGEGCERGVDAVVVVVGLLVADEAGAEGDFGDGG